ncbi:MAG: hypothetical protein ACYTDY_07055 [Planctomycetota bacterium]|jgi:hypothetical protein
MSRICALIPLAALLICAARASAGEGLDAAIAVVQARIDGLDQLSFTNPKAEKKAQAARDALAEGMDLLKAGDAKSVRRALKRIGKGMVLLGKAAKKEEVQAVTDFASETDTAIWGAFSAIFVGGGTSEPPTDEQAKLLEKLGRKMKGAVKAATREKFGKAVQKLSKAWATLILIRPDP